MLVKIKFGLKKNWIKKNLGKKNWYKLLLVKIKFGSKKCGRKKKFDEFFWGVNLFLHESSSLVELSLHSENQLNR